MNENNFKTEDILLHLKVPSQHNFNKKLREVMKMNVQNILLLLARGVIKDVLMKKYSMVMNQILMKKTSMSHRQHGILKL